MSIPPGALRHDDGTPVTDSSGNYLVSVPPEPGNQALVDNWASLLDYIGVPYLGHRITDTLTGAMVVREVTESALFWQRDPRARRVNLAPFGTLSGLWTCESGTVATVDTGEWVIGYAGTGPGPLAEYSGGDRRHLALGALELDGVRYARVDPSEHAAVLTDRGLLVR